MKTTTNLGLAALILASSSMLGGCEEAAKVIICNDVCDTTFDCDEDILHAVDPTCDLQVDDADIVMACERACKASLDKLTASDREVVADCMRCINRELGSYQVCTIDSWNGAVDACTDCADDDFNDFYSGWSAEYDITTYDAYDIDGNLCEWPF